jgi:hypothetical protein
MSQSTTIKIRVIFASRYVTFSIISIFGSQQDARNIAKGFTPGHKNIHFLLDELEQYNTSVDSRKAKAPTEHKKAIEAEGEFKKVPLYTRVFDRAMCIGAEATQ